MIGAGISDIDTGLRLRYEIDRKFAPYLGVVYEGKFGQTASLAKRAGESTAVIQAVVSAELMRCALGRDGVREIALS
jgi:copper resistance protein B